MNHDPIDDLLARFLGNPDPRAMLLDPFHPATLFCVVCIVMGMLMVTLLTAAG